MIFLSRLTSPSVNAVHRKPYPVDPDERYENEAEPNDHADAAETVPEERSYTQCQNDLQHPAPPSLFGIEMPKRNVARDEETRHEEETDEHRRLSKM